MQTRINRRMAALTSAAVLGAGAGGPALANAAAPTTTDTGTGSAAAAPPAPTATTTATTPTQTSTDTAGSDTTPATATAPATTTASATTTAATNTSTEPAASTATTPGTTLPTSTASIPQLSATSPAQTGTTPSTTSTMPTAPTGALTSQFPATATATRKRRCRRGHRKHCRRRDRTRATKTRATGARASATTQSAAAGRTASAASKPKASTSSSLTSLLGNGQPTVVADVFGQDAGTDPATIQVLSGLLAGRDEPPAKLVAIYRAAAARYGVPWQVLAAINAVETDYGQDEKTSSAGAVGWMQFMPATWRKYAARRHGKIVANPYSAHDAIFAAAKMLAADGGRTDLRRAIFAYNHSDTYVAQVLDIAQAIVDRQAVPSATAKVKLKEIRTAAQLLKGSPYVWGGGHAGWASAAGYDCSGFVSAVLHAAGYLKHPQDTQTLVSAHGIVRGVGKFVTIFDRTNADGLNSDHVIIDIDGQWWESGGGSSTGGGADVHRISHVSAKYLATFNRIVHPKGL